MSFIDRKEHTKASKFTKEKLLGVKPKHVLAYLTHKAFGSAARGPEARPLYARSNHIKNCKMKLSYFMPSGSAWVDLPDGTGHGNPTRHRLLNKLIADIIQFEIRGEGAEGRDVRDMQIAEYQKEMELFRAQDDPICKYRNPLVGLYQCQFITRADDVCNFKVDDPKGHPLYDVALAQSVKWSKNVRDSRNCPDQLLLASRDYKTCMFAALAMWLDYFLGNHPNATHMMSAGLPDGRSKAQHKKFTGAISKTYRNRWCKVVLKNKEFQAIYKGPDKRKLGLHSKRKMGSTQAKRRGASGDQVDHRGRWVIKKGSRIVNQVYIDPEDLYADAVAASKLAMGGPIAHKLKDGIATHVTISWLGHNVIPNVAARYGGDHSLIKNLGLAMLWLIMDEEAAAELAVPQSMIDRTKSAYDDLPTDNKPTQPVARVSLHIYRHGEETIIEEVAQRAERQQDQQDQQGRPATVADELARIPGSGGNDATQHVLQTVVIQQRNLQQQLQELQQAMITTDQRNRVWMDNKFRQINGTVRRFGGTIQGGLARQHPERQAEVRRVEAEGPPAEPYYRRRGRVWPTLAPNIRDLMVLWAEWEYGIAGRKPAKAWTRTERGAGGKDSVKQMFHRRNNVWGIQQLLVNKGRSITQANTLIERTYGNISITGISEAIVRDRKAFERHGGLHPNFR